MNLNNLILAALMLAAPALPAQDAAGPGRGSPDDQPKWYTVELIVFEHAGSERSNAPAPDPIAWKPARAENLERIFREFEGMVPDQPPLEYGSQIPLRGTTASFFGTGAVPDFFPVPESDRAGAGYLARLQRSGAYRVLSDMAWRQRAATFGDGRPVLVSGGRVLGSRERGRQASAGDRASRQAGFSVGTAFAAEQEAIHELEGTVSLTEGRFLHLNLDMVLRQYSPVGPIRTWSDADESGWPAWRLAERRQINPGQLHYFDHYRMGAIALVRPWRRTVPESDTGPIPEQPPAAGTQPRQGD